MSVKSGQAVTVDFTTADPTTGAAANASALPTAKLVVNGTDNAAVVTVTNKATGVYKAAVTLPTLTAGDVVSIRVAATVATVAGVGVVWTDVADTKRVSDLNDLAAGAAMTLTAAYDAAKAAASQASVNALVDGVTLATDQPLYAPTTWRDLEPLAKKADVQVTVNPTLTPEESAKLLGAAQEATVATLPTAEHNAKAVDALLSAIHGAGSWEGGVPTEGVLITQDSIGDDDLPLGPIMPYGTLSAYLGEDLAYVFDEIGDANGNFAITLPYGTTWTLVATNPPHYRTTTAIITTPPQP